MVKDHLGRHGLRAKGTKDEVKQIRIRQLEVWVRRAPRLLVPHNFIFRKRSKKNICCVILPNKPISVSWSLGIHLLRKKIKQVDCYSSLKSNIVRQEFQNMRIQNPEF